MNVLIPSNTINFFLALAPQSAKDYLGSDVTFAFTMDHNQPEAHSATMDIFFLVNAEDIDAIPNVLRREREKYNQELSNNPLEADGFEQHIKMIDKIVNLLEDSETYIEPTKESLRTVNDFINQNRTEGDPVMVLNSDSIVGVSERVLRLQTHELN